MGEYAEMMLDGTLCALCGEFLGGEEGHPTYCASCSREQPQEKIALPKVECPICKKKCKAAGVADHIKAVHSKRLSISGNIP